MCTIQFTTFTELWLWAAGCLLSFAAWTACAEPSNPSVSRQAELMTLLVHDCGACHGLTLSGGLGPALLPESLADNSHAVLTRTILEGRPGTAMPPWKGILSENDARWLAKKLKSGLTAQGMESK